MSRDRVMSVNHVDVDPIPLDQTLDQVPSVISHAPEGEAEGKAEGEREREREREGERERGVEGERERERRKRGREVLSCPPTHTGVPRA